MAEAVRVSGPVGGVVQVLVLGTQLAAGDRAPARGPAGELELTVILSEDLPRGVAFSPKGRWPKLEAGHANVNALNPGIASDMGASTTVHGVEITLARA